MSAGAGDMTLGDLAGAVEEGRMRLDDVYDVLPFVSTDSGERQAEGVKLLGLILMSCVDHAGLPRHRDPNVVWCHNRIELVKLGSGDDTARGPYYTLLFLDNNFRNRTDSQTSTITVGFEGETAKSPRDEFSRTQSTTETSKESIAAALSEVRARWLSGRYSGTTIYPLADYTERVIPG